MYHYLKVVVLTTALVVPVAFGAEDHNQERRQNDQQMRHYEDKAHNDSHDWNESEDQAYRRYLQEHHKKYRNFERENKREQSDYWTWRHAHSEGH